MLWYLLSPIRGTTQPPSLSTTHPIRRAFYRHGKTTAQHWLVAMLVSVAIAAAFSYPTILVSENPTAGFSAFPRHVWTTAKPLSEGEMEPDVEMRQVWIYGSYMKALDRDVLSRGLAVQQSIVGDGQNALSAAPGVVPEPSQTHWAFHSPLMYWNNSQQSLADDPDILKTISEQRGTPSALNVVLRPASVFAGKRFDGNRILAADALIITLMNRVENDDSSSKWQDSMFDLTHGACENCTLFPQDGHVTNQRIYEFSFLPLSFQEHAALALAYGAMALYVLLSLRRMKAFHSRFGLVVTAITQMTCSILASLTICGVLGINLSMIPQNAYPFVVLVLGAENMFRLINAVLAYPPTMATEMRVANALGDVGPLSVAAVVQNLTILSLLSMVVSPGVAAFCAFAAIATLFDAFFLLTFFVAVLNVDIRRFELQDALTARVRHTQQARRHRRRPSPSSQSTWFDALLQGRLPFSTRMAGTAVTTTFILALNYHFFEHREKATSLRDFLGLVSHGHHNLGDTFAPPSMMNATLTPGEWMRMQDFDTAKEVMRLAKPGGDSFIVRVYAPLVVILGGSDRTSHAREAWPQALRSFALHHFYPMAVAVVFAVAFVAVLMNFLLYNEAGDEENDRDLEDLEDALTVETVLLPHTLDVVRLASNENGHFVTVALDRTIAMTIADQALQTHHTSAVPAHGLDGIQWPIRDLAISDSGEGIACHGADDRVALYSRSADVFRKELLQYPDDNPAIIFALMGLPGESGHDVHLVVLTSGGRLAMASVTTESQPYYTEVTNVPLVGAAILERSGHEKCLYLVTEEANLISYSWDPVSSRWTVTSTQNLPLNTLYGRIAGPVGIELAHERNTEVLVVHSSTTLVFLDSSTLAHIGKLEVAQSGASVDSIMLCPGRHCPSCDGFTLRKVAVSGETYGKNRFALTTWSAEDDDDADICLAKTSATCRPFDSAAKATHEVTAPGAWHALGSQAILGLRRKPQPETSKQKSASPGMKRRKQGRRNSSQRHDPLEQWEAYKLSIDGDLETLDMRDEDDNARLYVQTAGPLAAIDGQSVACAVGNVVKVIRASRRGCMSRRSGATALDRQSSVSSRRRASNRMPR